LEIKESYKERLSESGDNSGLIVVISANWMTLGFANAKRNVPAQPGTPRRSAPQLRETRFEPFACRGGPGAGAKPGASRAGGPAAPRPPQTAGRWLPRRGLSAFGGRGRAAGREKAYKVPESSLLKTFITL